ncbi:DUF3592 domain-containing protein [Nocardioides sp. NPDC047086]|uniref:DUF3592 domain-containing protein n=1 Tax=Nocardioides sp. NPDC047086 TaxID=3154810 RepID=UPI0033C19BB3
MWIGWFFALGGLAFVGFGIAMVVTTIVQRQRLQSWNPSTATVREFETRRRSSSQGGSRTYLVAHYEYRGPNGEEYADEGTVSEQRFAVDGSPVSLPIVIDPLDPSRSMVAGESTPIGCVIPFAIAFGAFGALFALVGLGLTQASVR